MSYDIGSVEYIGDGRLTMFAKDRDELADEFEDDLPGGSFLTEDDAVTPTVTLDGLFTPGAEVQIVNPWWYGEGSGRSFEILRDEVLTKTKGRADLLFTWEDGDSHSGLRVEDGKVTECEVMFSLKPIEDKKAA